MTIFQLILMVGVGLGLVAVASAYFIGRLQNRFHAAQNTHNIPRSREIFGDGPSLFDPAEIFGEMGQGEKASQSVDMMVMKPTVGAKFYTVILCSFCLTSIWIPLGMNMSMGPLMDLTLTAAILYTAVYISIYEVSYNEKGLTAPDLLFKRVFYPWEDFIFIRQHGNWDYKLKFDTGTVTLKKYLVGVPVFLSFVAGVRDLNRRA